MPFEPNRVCERIDAVLTQRRNLCKRINNLEGILTALCKNLDELLGDKYQHDAVRSSFNEDYRQEFNDYRQRAEEAANELERRRLRYAKPYLCIGVAGQRGHGKSSFLQGVTGLGDNYIPSGEGLDVTGAQTLYINDPTIETPEITLYFHTESSFMKNVVQPMCGANSLRSPNTLEEFITIMDAGRFNGCDRRNVIAIRALWEFFARNTGYVRLLEGNNRRLQNVNDLPNWIVRYQGTVEAPIVQPQTFLVEHVEMRCAFPGLGDAKIAVLDTPGLGDPRVEAGPIILQQSFENHVDCGCILRKVSDDTRTLGTTDVQLLKTVGESIRDLEPSRWIRFILNFFTNGRQDSLETITRSLRDATSPFYPFHNRSNVVSAVQSGDVRDLFADIVAGMAHNQAENDGLILDASLRRILDLSSQISGAMDGVLRFDEQMQIGAVFEDQFQELYGSFKRAVMGIRDETRSIADTQSDYGAQLNDEFKEQLDRITEETKNSGNVVIDREIPGKEPDERRVEVRGNLRSLLGTSYDKLNVRINEKFAEYRKRTLKVFCEDAHLNFLLNQENRSINELKDKDVMNCLTNLAREFKRRGEVASRIGYAISRFISLNYSIHFWAISTIRHHRDMLDVNILPDGEKRSVVNEGRRGDSWEVFSQALKKEFSATVESCSKSLQNIPTEALSFFADFYVIFYDGLFYSEGATASENAWRSFYRTRRENVWPEDAAARNLRILLNDWNALLDRINRSLDDLDREVGALTPERQIPA